VDERSIGLGIRAVEKGRGNDWRDCEWDVPVSGMLIAPNECKDCYRVEQEHYLLSVNFEIDRRENFEVKRFCVNTRQCDPRSSA